jgi:steroid delta-isomerase-like uncharacterized protein
MPTTQAEANKEAIHRLCDAGNTGDLAAISAVIDAVIDPDVHNTTPLPVTATGTEGLKQVQAMLLGAFPDLHIHIEEMVAEDDRVAAHNVVTGTHQGTYMGVAGTGTTVTWREMFLFRFEAGRIVEIAGVVDVMSQMRQLGLLPRPTD